MRATQSDFVRTPHIERIIKYATAQFIEEEPPVQALESALNRLRALQGRPPFSYDTELLKQMEDQICSHMSDDPDETECSFCDHEIERDYDLELKDQ